MQAKWLVLFANAHCNSLTQLTRDVAGLRSASHRIDTPMTRSFRTAALRVTDVHALLTLVCVRV